MRSVIMCNFQKALWFGSWANKLCKCLEKNRGNNSWYFALSCFFFCRCVGEGNPAVYSYRWEKENLTISDGNEFKQNIYISLLMYDMSCMRDDLDRSLSSSVHFLMTVSSLSEHRSLEHLLEGSLAALWTLMSVCLSVGWTESLLPIGALVKLHYLETSDKLVLSSESKVGGKYSCHLNNSVGTVQNTVHYSRYRTEQSSP